ncbi:IS3 family transposase [Thalassoglobus polymorphus]|uniref:Integrase catalytic domain-containing protein n=1 Tax=Thalassoglobus polymorphus TaxID=2527994 RepID=A0A517QL77_9PLAN|nr:hypothetical protein Mal48_16350 [Thalassoglobus polymorphus]
MSRQEESWNNAPTESIFRILKKELIHHKQYETRVVARKSLIKYIEAFYNTI